MRASAKRKFSQVAASATYEEDRSFQIAYRRYLAQEAKPSSSVDTGMQLFRVREIRSSDSNRYDAHPDQQESATFHSSDIRYDYDGSTKNALSQAILETLDTGLHQTMETANQPSIIAREPVDKRRAITMRTTELRSSLCSLERAYSKELEQTFDNEYSTDCAASVREMADVVKHKLQVNCPAHVETGTELLVEFLRHCLTEFKCDKKILVLEEALTHVRQEKRNAYEEAIECKCQLRELRDA